MWFTAILVAGCGSAPAPDAPAVPTETRVRTAVSGLPAELDTDGPALAGRLAALSFGAPKSEVCQRVPPACGAPDPENRARVRVGAAWGKGADPPLVAVLLQVPDTGLVDALGARWGPPAAVDGQTPRWLGPTGVRAVFDHGHGPTGTVTVRLEPFLSTEALLAGQGFEFGVGAPLLGAPEAELDGRFAPFVVNRDPDRAWLRLWPVGDAFGDTLLVAELEQGRVVRFVFDVHPGARPTSDDLVAALTDTWGAPEASTGPEGERRLEFPGAPVRIERGLSSMSVLVGPWGDRWRP